jgi:hypothetical protein
MTTRANQEPGGYIIPARARPDLLDRGGVANIVLLVVICHTFDRLAYRDSPDNITTHHGRIETSPPPLFPLPSRGPIPLVPYPSKHEHKRSNGSWN